MVFCAPSALGRLLRGLEWEADVFVHGESTRTAGGTIMMMLRSDVFPAAWEGHVVCPIVGIGPEGIPAWSRSEHDYLVRRGTEDRYTHVRHGVPQ